MQLLLNHLDWLALAIGTIGTCLWAHNGKGAKYAAVFWMVSSLLWMTFAYFKGLPALGARDLISVLLYAYGGYRWLFHKKNRIEPMAQAKHVVP
ncbi:hypothetical protein LC612_38355 [Nostoc sp. CHAB 5834]|nr:hypothetical protein [Nostoc sp. CHAB 5834]